MLKIVDCYKKLFILKIRVILIIIDRKIGVILWLINIQINFSTKY